MVSVVVSVGFCHPQTVPGLSRFSIDFQITENILCSLYRLVVLEFGASLAAELAPASSGWLCEAAPDLAVFDQFLSHFG